MAGFKGLAGEPGGQENCKEGEETGVLEEGDAEEGEQVEGEEGEGVQVAQGGKGLQVVGFKAVGFDGADT